MQYKFNVSWERRNIEKYTFYTRKHSLLKNFSHICSTLIKAISVNKTVGKPQTVNN